MCTKSSLSGLAQLALVQKVQLLFKESAAVVQRKCSCCSKKVQLLFEESAAVVQENCTSLPPDTAVNLNRPPDTAVNLYRPPDTAVNLYRPPDKAVNLYRPPDTVVNLYRPSFQMAVPPIQMIAFNLDRASVTDDLWLLSKQACVLADVCISRAFECIAIFDFIPCIYFQLVTRIAIAAEVLFKGVLLGLYSHLYRILNTR
jgi:hypothetical protein